MTMFTRNDNVSEQDTKSKSPMRAVLETPAVTGAARFQAFAQQHSEEDETPRGPVASVISKALKMTGQLATSGDMSMTMFTRNDSTESDAPTPRERPAMSAMATRVSTTSRRAAFRRSRR